jgi:hypothetical protein
MIPPPLPDSLKSGSDPVDIADTTGRLGYARALHSGEGTRPSGELGGNSHGRRDNGSGRSSVDDGRAAA